VKIIFTKTKNVSEEFYPIPANKLIPEWYKKTDSYLGLKKIPPLEGGDGVTTATIKRCMPVFDVMTSGYLILSPSDVYVYKKINEENKEETWFHWRGEDLIQFHAPSQASIHPKANDEPFPKWNNPYSIKTEPGYSTLFLSPMHNPNGIFTILPGIVDTDKYTGCINFPFVLNNPKWTGLIPAGTPMAQVIPFKRDSWKMIIGSSKEQHEANLSTQKLKTLFFNSYKRQFWMRKEFK
jgi:hypothetical protein